MLILGIAGQAAAGKDTVSNYLCKRYGFIQVSFADALRWECQQAFQLPDQELFLNRETKEIPSDRLTLQQCVDAEFAQVVCKVLEMTIDDCEAIPLSPRHVLQWFGAEYRRAQDPDYWVKKAAQTVWQIHTLTPYPEQRPQLFVIPDCRFENEQRFIHGGNGNIWHIRRAATDKVGEDKHVSAIPLPVLDGERELHNNSDLDHLIRGVEYLLTTSHAVVRMEPMAPDEPPIPNLNPELLLSDPIPLPDTGFLAPVLVEEHDLGDLPDTHDQDEVIQEAQKFH